MLQWYRDEVERDDLPAVQQVSPCERNNDSVQEASNKECAANSKDSCVTASESCRVILT